MKAFCPAHVTCFFSPFDSDDVLKRGSKGAGIRLNLGTYSRVEEKARGRSEIYIDGVESEAPITRHVLDRLSPDRSFCVELENDLPIGQGFSTSASGAVATALCVCDIADLDSMDAFKAAHAADIFGGGGLGDVSGLMCDGHQPVRTKAGFPPYGCVHDTGISFAEITLAVLGPELDTGDVLADPGRCMAIASSGGVAVEDYVEHVGKDSLFDVSNRFSKDTGLESTEVSSAIDAMRAVGIRSAMCMLGNSIFIDSSIDMAKGVLDDCASLYGCRSTGESARIIRKA